MLRRDYNFRKHHTERIVKKNVKKKPYRYGEYNKIHIPSSIGVYKNYYVLNYVPEDKWFNYLGEYYRYFKKSTNRYSYTPYRKYENVWKEKHHRKRSRFKRISKKEIHDEIGKRYYISY